MAIQIRESIPEDNEFIVSLVERFSEFELPEWRQADEINNANRMSLQRALEQPQPGSAIFIAEDEAEGPVGFIHLETQTDYFSGEKHGYISDLAVSKSFEGRGIGRILLETAETWTRTKGYRLLTLYIFSGNTHAQRIYEKNGFSQEVVKYVKVVR